ncbi:sigma-70 family RNA polymerase sigma factor [Paenibacillus alvei]|nr:sigma-70 family RNA polymerase sigma factor [Paenibacillus alvei]
MRYILSLSSTLLTQIRRLTSRWNCRYAHAVAKDSTEEKEGIQHKTERLFEEHGTAILRLSYSYLHNLTDAEDVLQDTLLQYMRSVPRFENAAHEKAWLLRVAINISKNKIKSKEKLDDTELDEGLLSDDEQDLKFVWEAVSSLTVIYREVLHLFYQEGYSTAQIARILDKKETTIRSLLHRAREKLKIVLQEDYDFAE